jgi:hypothetical protein
MKDIKKYDILKQKKKLKEAIKISGNRLIDETDNKYGKLTVICYAGNGRELLGKDTGAMWVCKCECGNFCLAKASCLRGGKRVSCGCKRKKKPGIGSFNAMYRVRVHAAKLRKIEWNLTKPEVMEISIKPCEYCGKEPSNISNGSANGEFIYSGIDRIDPYKGYIIGNVVPCCSICNYAKRRMTISEFDEWISRVYKHRGLN